jgi:membrane peptidoglycan carboxypeptidase
VPVDLVARTTLDPALQDVAERIVGASLDREGSRANVSQAALVAMTHDGAVLAAVGGRDYGSSQFSRVTQARRQAGSLFKLFVYAAALEAGWRPDSPVVDQPVRIGSWEPQNYGGGHRGTTTLREAFAQSINTVAVQLSESVGRERVVDVARRLGIRSELPLVPSIALGSTEVTLIEVTAAFASAVGNTRVEPYVVSAVRARDRALYARAEPPSGVARSQAASVLSSTAQQDLMDLLLAVVREGTGRTARLQRPVAGKTGTTQEHRDAWFVGITADVVVGVWVGNDDNTPMNGVTGGELPARVWRDFVSEADRLKAAAAQAATPPPGDARARVAPPGPPPVAAAPPARALLRGPAVVMDTATLRIGRQVVRLAGLVGRGGGAAREMALYLAGREVVCEPAADAGYHRCRTGERDLSEVVLSNGGGRATTDADPALREAEAAARTAGRGIWEAQGR